MVEKVDSCLCPIKKVDYVGICPINVIFKKHRVANLGFWKIILINVGPRIKKGRF